MIIIAIAVAVAAKIVLSKTSVGMQLRAISDRPTAAELLGVPVKTLSVSVWVITGIITTGAMAIVVPTQSSDATVSTLLIVPGAAAALIGGFKRLDLAVIGGIALGVVQGLMVPFQSIYILRDWRKEVWDVAR
jgi:branched-chain amino acid transport system permease protein